MTIIDIPWHQPVSVQLQNGAERRFIGAYDALDFLENEWPIRKGTHYQDAIRLCRSALTLSTSGAVAREAFLAACLEAALPWTPGAFIPSISQRAASATA
jgi:hypothetical protein